MPYYNRNYNTDCTTFSEVFGNLTIAKHNCENFKNCTMVLELGCNGTAFQMCTGEQKESKDGSCTWRSNS